MRTKLVPFAVVTLLACSVFISGNALAQRDRTAERLITVAEGLQMPSSEADSVWSLVSYDGVEELPAAGPFDEMSGCRRSGVTRYDFGETLDLLGEVEPWMDAGQASSARGFRKLERVFDREFGEEVAVYRCDSGGPEIGLYFVGAEEDRLVGLMTVSIET